MSFFFFSSAVWCQGHFNGSGTVEGMSESLASWGSVPSARLVTVFWIFFPGESLALIAINWPCFWDQLMYPSHHRPVLTPAVVMGLTPNLSSFTATVQPGSWGCGDQVALVSLSVVETWENQRQKVSSHLLPKCKLLSGQSELIEKALARVAKRWMSGSLVEDGITLTSPSQKSLWLLFSCIQNKIPTWIHMQTFVFLVAWIRIFLLLSISNPLLFPNSPKVVMHHW